MTVDILKDYHDPGTPPGTLHPAEGESGPATVLLTRYSGEAIESREVTDLGSIGVPDPDGRAQWVHVIGLGDVETIRKLGQLYGLHPLALEDVVHLGQRPKVEDYGEVLFAILQHLTLRDCELEKRQVSMFLGTKFVVTFQPAGANLLESLRTRLEKLQGRMRLRGASYLAYAVLDLVVDAAFPALEAFGERLEDLEDELLARPDRAAAGRLQSLRRELLKLRQVLWPQREVLGKLAREEHSCFDQETRFFLRDCYDHAVQALEVSENYREMAAGLLDIFLTSLSNRLNDVMRVLTIISTVFMPLAFLAGVYGMNFDRSFPWNMPELGWKYGYLGFWGMSFLLTGGMLYLFRRKGWL